MKLKYERVKIETMALGEEVIRTSENEFDSVNDKDNMFQSLLKEQFN